jgi:hypothetical protein
MTGASSSLPRSQPGDRASNSTRPVTAPLTPARSFMDDFHRTGDENRPGADVRPDRTVG